MKKIKIIMLLPFSLVLGINTVWSQLNFIAGTTPPNIFGRTALGGNVQGIGIGSFTNLNLPQSAFHVNTNLLPVSTAFTSGELFRTSGPSNQLNSWRMFTGAGNGIERFRISSLANLNNAELGTVQNGTLDFLTNNTVRTTLLGTVTAPYDRSGFMGFNDPLPLFHVDINTQNPGGTIYGELMLRT